MVFSFQANDGDSDSLSGEDVPDPGPAVPVVTSIVLPKDYDSVQPINDLELINNFGLKSNSALNSCNEFEPDSAKVLFSTLKVTKCFQIVPLIISAKASLSHLYILQIKVPVCVCAVRECLAFERPRYLTQKDEIFRRDNFPPEECHF